MIIMTQINSDLIKAIGELAYVVAKAHDNIVLEEKETLYSILSKNLGSKGTIAKDRFDLLCEVTNPSLIHAYNNALHELKKSKQHVNKEFTSLVFDILNSVAESHLGKSTFQLFILDRLKHDLKSLNNGL